MRVYNNLELLWFTYRLVALMIRSKPKRNQLRFSTFPMAQKCHPFRDAKCLTQKANHKRFERVRGMSLTSFSISVRKFEPKFAQKYAGSSI